MSTNLTGSSNCKETPKGVSLVDFDTLDCIGSGSFGKVYKVRHKTQMKIYALKIILKKTIYQNNSERFIQTEKDIMAKVTHPYIVSLKYAFHSKSRIFFVMEFLSGGELFKHLKIYGCLTEEQTRIFIAEIASAIGHLHSLNIIHRDIKPQNILLQNDGHIALSDFGLARYFDANESNMIGNNLYIAPELIQGWPCRKEVDWWSLGCVMYEMLLNKPPFSLNDPASTYEQILNHPLKFPPFLSKDCVHILSGLLNRDRNHRIGSEQLEGFTNVRNHPFFAPLNWDKLFKKEIPPPVQFETPSPSSPVENIIHKIEPKVLLASPTIHSTASPEFRSIEFLHPDLMPPPLDLNNSNSSIPLLSSGNNSVSPELRKYIVDLSPSSNRRPRSCSCLTIKEGNKRGYKNVNRGELKQLLGILSGKQTTTQVSNWARRLSVDELDTGHLPSMAPPPPRMKRYSFAN